MVAENPPVKSSPRTRSRWTLILLVPVVAGILSLFSDPYSYSLYPSSFPFTVSVFSAMPLATLEWFYAYLGRIQKRKLFLQFSIGIAATVGSAFHTTMLMAAGPCDPGVSGGGFPLPWYLTFLGYTGRGPYPPCPLLVNRPWGVFGVFSFLFDTIFYTALAIAGIEFYHRARVRGRQRQGSLPESPKEVA